MEKVEQTVRLITLTASEGKWLTQVKDVPLSDRVFGKVININAATQNADDWKEITDEEYQQMQSQIEAQMRDSQEDNELMVV
jgi:hypothetical protein